MSKVCAAAIIISDSKVLLGRRSAGQALHPNVWDLPGGHVEAGESPEVALIRELEEELGVVATTFEPLGVIDELNPEKYGPYKYHLYLVTAWTGTVLNRQPDEHSEIRWVTGEAARCLELADARYPEILQRALERFERIISAR